MPAPSQDPGPPSAPRPSVASRLPSSDERRRLTLAAERVITATDDYLHAEFTSWLFHAIDDVEFHVDADSRRLHFRSAARTNHADFGGQRTRLEKLRAEITAELAGI